MNKRFIVLFPLLITTFHRSFAFHRVNNPVFAMKTIKNFFQSEGSSSSNKKARLDSTTASVADVPSTVPPESSVDLSLKKRKRVLDDDAEKEGNITKAVAESTSETTTTVVKINDVIVGWPPFDTMEPSWQERLQGEYRKPYFQKLLKFLDKECKTQTVFPPSSQIFTALNLCPYNQVKVVIIGQDPYHGPGQAHGLAFSVQKGVAIPPSLKNMINEAKNDPKVQIPTPTHGNLESWSKQGVLLLNAVLTVRQSAANSHQKQGWEEFTDAVVKELRKQDGIVYLLWGKPAQAKCSGINREKNVILTSSHPSPLSAYKTDQPFIGSR